MTFDGLGSVTGLTNPSGDVTATYHLDAWGNYRFTSELETSHNRFGFTGHYWDKEASLYYAKARYYDPFTARFTQADSFPGKIDEKRLCGACTSTRLTRTPGSAATACLRMA
jgi:RHS repeat-associated protein